MRLRSFYPLQTSENRIFQCSSFLFPDSRLPWSMRMRSAMAKVRQPGYLSFSAAVGRNCPLPFPSRGQKCPTAQENVPLRKQREESTEKNINSEALHLIMETKRRNSETLINQLMDFPVDVLEAALLILRTREQETLRETARLKNPPNEMFAKHFNSFHQHSGYGSGTFGEDYAESSRTTSFRGSRIHFGRAEEETEK